MRSIWSGTISMGLATIPVKLYKAIKEHEAKFGLVSPCCQGEIGYRKVCKVCGREVAWEELQRGYRMGQKMLVFTKDELEALESAIKQTKSIDVIGFADIGEIDPLRFAESYYIGSAEGGEKALAVLSRILALTNKVAIARLVMRQKEHLVMIRAYREGLVLTSLFWADEVRKPPEIAQVELTKRDIATARAFIEQMKVEWDELDREKDRYYEEFKKLLEKKLAGEPIEIREVKVEAVDLMKALEASVKMVKKTSKS